MAKSELKKKKRAHESSDDEDEVRPNKMKKAKKDNATKDLGKDDEGNSFWQLSANRRVGISDFKGKKFINIREFYTDASGDLKPGKKGISLPLDQWNKLVKAIPALNAELESQGHEVVELGSSTAATSATTASHEKKAKKPTKSNIDATSSEEVEEDEEH